MSSVKSHLGHMDMENDSTISFAWLQSVLLQQSLRKQATIHQVTTMLVTFKSVLFPGHNHMLTTSAADPTQTLTITRLGWWLPGG